jgi:hypothetical protein
MPSAGFEPAIPTTKLPQTYGLDRAETENFPGLPILNMLIAGYDHQ